jgi:sulfur relay protein TusB/DsrH
MKSKLYLISKPLYSSGRFGTLKKLLIKQKNKTEKLAVVLIEDSVTGLMGRILGEIKDLYQNNIQIYALMEDMKARGIRNNIDLKEINFLTYNQLINLIMNDYEHIINYT